jgi:hypothetical protein
MYTYLQWIRRLEEAMNKVYKHRPLAIDDYLGYISDDGKVYEILQSRKTERYVGRVDLETGQVYSSIPGQDRYVGRTDKNGKIYISRTGPDEYIGHVTDSGRLFHHKRLAFDEYLGVVSDMDSFAHAGAAFLLLIHPLYEQEKREELEEKEEKKERKEREADEKRD